MNIISNNTIKSLVAITALQNVYDPEIGLNVVDLGLIYQIDFDEDTQKIICTMTLTTQFCPMGESICDGVKNALQHSFAGYTADVNLTFEPSWSYDMISEEGRSFLGR